MWPTVKSLFLSSFTLPYFPLLVYFAEGDSYPCLSSRYDWHVPELLPCSSVPGSFIRICILLNFCGLSCKIAFVRKCQWCSRQSKRHIGNLMFGFLQGIYQGIYACKGPIIIYIAGYICM